jgi:hypothetical protein
MALETIVARSGSMFEDLNIRDLFGVWLICANVVAFITSNAIVVSVLKDRFEVVLGLSRPVIRSQLMADAALADLLLRRMASVATRMSLKAYRYCLSGS